MPLDRQDPCEPTLRYRDAALDAALQARDAARATMDLAQDLRRQLLENAVIAHDPELRRQAAAIERGLYSLASAAVTAARVALASIPEQMRHAGVQQ